MNQSALPQEDLLQARVSGYYTSSQSTLASVTPQYANHLSGPFCDQLGQRFQKLRKQSDLQLIRCVQDNFKSKHSYFMKPPLSNITLFFKSEDMEREYRETVHTISDRPGEMIPTLATSRYNTYFDILISAIIFTTIFISLFILYIPTAYSVPIFVISFCIQLFAVILCIRQIIHFTEDIFSFFCEWYRWHTLGAFIVSLPVVVVLSNFPCYSQALVNVSSSDCFYCYLFFVSLIHFCNFTQFNCWMKNGLATIFVIIFLCVVTLVGNSCVHVYSTRTNLTNEFMSQTSTEISFSNFNNKVPDNITLPLLHNNGNETYFNSIQVHNINLPKNTTNPLFRTLLQEEMSIKNYDLYESEIFLVLFLLLVLVWFLNREFEIGYRLSFHANLVANRDKAHVQSMKNQADWLLHNIIPKHVADQLKKSAKYSENHKNVGIIFASIVNFNEMYDESYLGGKEFLRVLNELIADFDELLTLSEFKSVEKIKTIGSTFMAASGLNPEVRRDSRDPYQHLYALMDFAMAMQKVIDNFNQNLLEFNLILRVGYNFGDVTAGVIGTSKLYYDIWGDAVNIASRMDSTGVNGRIQIGGACLEVLEKRYEFEPRGSVYVKGKDNMNVYLLLRKKDEVSDGDYE